MKIAIIRRRFSSNGSGGAEKYAAYIASMLTRNGHTVTVFAEEFSGVPEGVRTVTVPKKKWTLCHTDSFAKTVRGMLRNDDFDIVYSLCRYYPADIVRITEQVHAAWLPIAYGSLAKWNPRHRAILNLEKKAYSREFTRWIVTNSNLTGRQVAELYGFPAERISTLRNGVDRTRFYPPDNNEREAFRKEFNIPESRFIMLFVGANFKAKGLDIAIRAFAGLEEQVRKNAQLFVVGGDNPEPFRATAEKAGLEESQIFFAGNQREMRKFYSLADILFFPSRYEPFANVCLESAACGLPVITSALNGSSETVRHGQSGYVIDDLADYPQMFRCLNDFVHLPLSKRQEFRENAIAAVAEYSWEKHIAELEQLLQRIREEKEK